MLLSKKVLCALFLVFQLALPTASIFRMSQPDQVFGLSSTLVVDNISSNTTWNPSSSPYIIANDIIVESGVVLTVEPGVDARFDGNYSLTVYGTLRALGTAANPIVFTSNKAQPSPGDWNTIGFVAAQNETMSLANMVVEYAKNGITVQSVGMTQIESSRIRNNSASGIYVVGKSNLTMRSSVVELNANGVLTSGESVSGISIIDCIVEHNNEGIHAEAWAAHAAAISNISIVGNTVSYNGRGVYFHIWAGFYDYDISRIYDVLISGNYVTHNDYGIYVYSGGPWFGSVYRTSILRNQVSFNRFGLYVFANLHYSGSLFDLLMSENVVAWNSDWGIYVTGGTVRSIEDGIRANVTGNSVSHNSFGVIFDGDTLSVAHTNDVYENACGMNVTDGASVDAADNFWGDSSGPFHALLYPSGKGDSVNGDGVNLDFSPFLSGPVASVRPWSVLGVDKSQLGVNELVTFDGSQSVWSERIVGYFFDFGDGSNSGWVSGPVFTHAYASVGNYSASLKTLYEAGIESNNAATLALSVLPGLVVSIVLGADSANAGDELMVSVHVTDGSRSVAGASVVLHSSGGGSFSPEMGESDSDGDLVVKFTVPSVVEQQVVEIVANASKGGYRNGVSQRQVTVSPKSRNVWIEFIVLLAVALPIALAVLLLFRRRRTRDSKRF
jgi:hypothetical protein